MNKATKLALGFAAGLILLGWAGNVERTEQVIYHMPEKTYNAIKAKLGDDASESKIAREYLKNPELWKN